MLLLRRIHYDVIVNNKQKGKKKQEMIYFKVTLIKEHNFHKKTDIKKEPERAEWKKSKGYVHIKNMGQTISWSHLIKEETKKH